MHKKIWLFEDIVSYLLSKPYFFYKIYIFYLKREICRVSALNYTTLCDLQIAVILSFMYRNESPAGLQARRWRHHRINLSFDVIFITYYLNKGEQIDTTVSQYVLDYYSIFLVRVFTRMISLWHYIYVWTRWSCECCFLVQNAVRFTIQVISILDNVIRSVSILTWLFFTNSIKLLLWWWYFSACSNKSGWIYFTLCWQQPAAASNCVT